VSLQARAIDAPLPLALRRSGAGLDRITERTLSLPLLGALLAAALIVSRRPDAITHAQFWAEDGKLFYADVYDHGLLATLAVPQAGYFQELPILAAWLAQLVPLNLAPLVMNLVGLAVRVLPVGLLLSERAETISPDIRVRGLLAALYIGLPGSPESNVNADNALWFLAVSAVIVLMLRPPASRSARALDVAIVAMSALTGVFSIALAPLAFLYRRWRGRAAVSPLILAILTAGAALQLLAIFVLQYHLPHGFGATSRPSMSLHPTLPGFFQILGTRVIAEPVLGNSAELPAMAAAVIGLLATVCFAIAFRRGPAQLRLMIGFGAALFAMALAHPIGTDWPRLALFPTGARYFIIPQLAAAATLVWAIGYASGHWRLVLAALLLYACLFTIPRDWTYAPLEETAFAQQAAEFEHKPRGAHMIFALQPQGWTMTLFKH